MSAWEKCFGRYNEERWGDCEGLRGRREWKIWWITSSVKQKRVCMKKEMAGTITSFKQTGSWHVYQIPCGIPRWHINALPQEPRLCVSLHVWENECPDLCIPPLPQRRVHGGLCVCVTPSAKICLLISASSRLIVFVSCFFTRSLSSSVLLSCCQNGWVCSQVIALTEMRDEFLMLCTFLCEHSMWPQRWRLSRASL